MTKLALATALVAALSSARLGIGGQDANHSKASPRPTPLGHQLKSKFLRKTSKRDTVTDPYWTPCDYQSAWACGGD